MLQLFNKKKIINSRSISLLIKTFAKQDNWHNIDLSSGNLGYGWIHYAFLRNLRPKRVLCIGSRYGFIPAICALACKDNLQGVVDFVDAGYDEKNENDGSTHWGGVGYWKTKRGIRCFSDFGLNNIQSYIMTTENFYKTCKGTNWGYIYIDGDHSYRGIKYDFEHFWPRLKKGGLLSIHDIYTQNLGNLSYGVHTFWKELKRSHSHQTLEFSGECGLGIVQKI